MGSNPTPCKTNFINWLQWRNRLAHGTYRQYIEKCRGCEFEPHLEQYVLRVLLLYSKISPRPGIEPGPSTWQAEILTTRLSRTWRHRLEASDTEGRHFRWIFQKSFEPDLNQRPMDVWYITTTVHRSTNWAIEGWMVAIYKAESILIISNNVLELHITPILVCCWKICTC